LFEVPLLGYCLAVATQYVSAKGICELFAGRLLGFAVVSAYLQYFGGLADRGLSRRMISTFALYSECACGAQAILRAR
jgi:hypothetical protein